MFQYIIRVAVYQLQLYSTHVHLRVCMSACLCVCVSFRLCMCVSVYTITQKNNGSILLKLEHIVLYENSSDEFDIEHCPIKVKVTA